MATVTEIIEKLDEQILLLISDPGNITTYSIGGKSVHKTAAILALKDLRTTYQKILEDTPYESIEHISLDFGPFGTDESEYIGDSALAGENNGRRSIY